MFLSLCEAVTLISDLESQQRHSPKIALHIHSMKIRGSAQYQQLVTVSECLFKDIYLKNFQKCGINK